ncbi:hypothetical protein [Halomontanus rarus]|uniref:hypothetical protein n=1 Tax=Halomontanus rarus TaxID=3034020 RepID=UPI0023E8CB6B|nr:hypothetical protein [Halovivax sp. TS33]
MVPSVTVTDRTKAHLEELRAKIRLETGRTVTQQELLEWIVLEAVESTDELIDPFRDEFEPLTDDEIDRWLSGTVSSGVETDESDIDRFRYD